MSVRTANYVITEQFTHYANGYGGEGKTLPQGASVKPIEARYVPDHVKEAKCNSGFDEKVSTYAYCRFGIVVIPKNIIVER